ncbi:MAG: class II aldolase/adducin family protein [Betaproteobacteria bacterium]|nr:class II aldolase/adducin family protein [Betaproteobacteria bacterium]
MSDDTLRERIVHTARAMNALGINQGKSGNVSARVEGGFLVTPSGIPYEHLLPVDLVHVGLDGQASGPREPSSEWRFHRDIYRTRPEAGAVVHTHSSYATTFACLGRAIPPFHYEVAFAGGKDIRCAPYRTFGTQELSDVALAALEGRRACLLAQHGAIAFGTDLADALRLADKVEHLARIYWQALQVGEPPLLSDGEMALMAERFRHYGPRPG